MCAKHMAVDLGSSSGKMLIGEITSDRRIQIREVGSFITPRMWYNDHKCINIYYVLKKICDNLRKLGMEGIYPDSFGADSWSSDFGIVNPEGELVGIPVFYRDWRTTGMPEEVEKFISYKELYRYTTQRRMQDSTLCQLIALMKEKPSLLDNGNKILFLGDLLMQFFSGRICSEITLASYSQLYSMEHMRWENAVFEMFGIPKSICPEVVHSCKTLGRVSPRMASAFGINRFEVVAPAGHDTSSAVSAIPALPGQRWGFISTGSWYLVGMELDYPMNMDMCHHYNFSNTGLAFGKTMLKRNVAAMWLLQECMKSWEKRGIHYSYPELHALADRADPFYAMLDTDASDFYNPDDMVEAICNYLARTGQKTLCPENAGQITRLINEGIAFKCAYAINCLENITKETLDVIYIVGGGSAADTLNAMIADACNKEIITGPREATSIGNCLLQACGCGEISSSEELREIVGNSINKKRYYPVNDGCWAEHYEPYRQFCNLNP